VAFTVKIDKHSCLASGHCMRAEPEAFGSDDDHLGDVRPAAADLDRERLLAVARACPALAISVHDADGREIEPG
jgi:ferredoxin